MTGTPAAAWSRSTPLMMSTATGSRPENGSSRIRISGSWTRAAASCTRCWLPRLSLMTSSPRRCGDPQSLGPRLHRPVGCGRVHPVQPGQVDQLLADLHAGIQPALLGHVADPAAHVGVDRASVPADRTVVGLQHTQDDPHGRRLPRSVRADEAEDLACADVERQIGERTDRAIGLVETVELQGRHTASQSSVQGSRQSSVPAVPAQPGMATSGCRVGPPFGRPAAVLTARRCWSAVPGGPAAAHGSTVSVGLAVPGGLAAVLTARRCLLVSPFRRPGGRPHGSTVTLIASPFLTIWNASSTRSSGMCSVIRSLTGTCPVEMYSRARLLWSGDEPFAPCRCSWR